MIVLHKDANASSSFSFELLNLAVIFRHWYGKSSQNTQVTAYLQKPQELLNEKEWVFIFYFKNNNVNHCSLWVYMYMYNILQNVNYAIYKCYIFIIDIWVTFDTRILSQEQTNIYLDIIKWIAIFCFWDCLLSIRYMVFNIRIKRNWIQRIIQ